MTVEQGKKVIPIQFDSNNTAQERSAYGIYAANNQNIFRAANRANIEINTTRIFDTGIIEVKKNRGELPGLILS